MTNGWNAARHVLIAPALLACASPSRSSEESALTVCTTRWIVELPHQDPELILRGCLAEDVCADDLTVNLDMNVGSNPACGENADMVCPGTAGPRNGHVEPVSMQASWQGLPPQPESSDRWYRLTVTLVYDESVSSMLRETDRAELHVRSGSGEVVIDSVSRVPYAASEVDGVLCKGVTLNLDTLVVE